MTSAEKRLYDAAQYDRLEEVEALLRDNPSLDINWKYYKGWTALHAASWQGHVEVFKILLAHPAIQFQVQTKRGFSPFVLGCKNGQLPVVRLLLNDPRVDITLTDHEGHTPLWRALLHGLHGVIEWLIASGRDLRDLGRKGRNQEDGHDYSVLEIAREKQKTEVVQLLERFMTNPMLTRHELRVRLGVLDELAAEHFALIVFLCDDLLQLKATSLFTNTYAAAAAIRFFSMASRLPMELQVVLCHRVVGSMRQNIRGFHKHQGLNLVLEDVIFLDELWKMKSSSRLQIILILIPILVLDFYSCSFFDTLLFFMIGNTSPFAAGALEGRSPRPRGPF